MTISLAQLIVPAHDKETSADFFARIFGLDYHGPVSQVAPIRINPGLVIIFETRVNFLRQRYSFSVAEDEFDEIFARMRDEGLRYGTSPADPTDLEIRERQFGRSFHFHDPSGHLLEVLSGGEA
jgi:catechol 2,3-dioxygenase-like lactoylglutathione lyase family enzyme